MFRAMKNTLLALILTVSLSVSISAQTYTVGDINADHKVDIKDVLILSLQWLDPSGCFGSGCADLDGLNGINMVDFSLLAANWQDIRTHLVISEFMATNTDTIMDGDGESSDWIEIYNPTDTAISLDGWYLTDDNTNLTKWQFPNGLDIGPGQFLIIFASEKTFELYPYNYPYLDPAGYYHTNFNLDKDPGEYLAIVAPDGRSVVHEYAPEYPEQLSDVSYGLEQYATTLVATGANASYHVPDIIDAILGIAWKEVEFDDSTWETGPTSIGFGSIGSKGTILREYWTGITGTSVSDLTNNTNFPDNPSGSSEPTLFEAPTDWANDYGTRMRGFVHPPVGGDYTFWIASDDASELWLSTDANPTNKSMIANVSSWTNSRVWTQYASQQSSSIILTGGNKYYIEALQKEGGGGDNLAVTWDGPGINFGNPIDGQHLSPWTGSWIATDVNEDMRSTNSSLWIRIKFELEEGQWETFDTLALRMIYEDGFIAYINGKEVASRNAPDPVEWNSTALSDRPDDNASDYEFINLTAYLGTLQTGMNVLSIHALNDNKDNGDFLILPELVAATNVKDPQYFVTATPGTFNVPGALGRVSDVWFSHKHGFYEVPFKLNLYTADDDTEIRYTLDGSRPTIMHGITYTGSIDIDADETTTIRAAAVKPGWLDSNIETHTFLLNASDTIKGLPVVSLVGDYGETFYEPNGVMAIVGGYYDGGVWVPDSPDAYNNPIQRGMAFERPVSFELIKPWNNTGLQADSGLRIHGSDWMRPRYRRCGGYWTGDCKFSFRLYFRNQYGDNRLEYPLFPFKIDSYKSIVLRGGHNDRTNPFIKDELIRRLHMDMGHCASGGIMANLLINGEYKGYFNPCEHIKSQFCQEWYGSDKEWDVMTMNGIRDGETVRWDYMLNYARNNDLSNDEHYQEVGRYLDIPAFADYLILQLWSGNWDWPQNNWAAASERSEEGRWRFFIWDAEGGMFSDRLNTVYLDRLNSQGNANGYLYRALKVNVNFRQLFADRVYKHFFNDGALTNANIEKRFYELRDEMLGVLPNMNTYVVDTWTPQRRNIIFNAFINEGIYFSVEAPEFYINGQYQHGGRISSDDELTMDNPNGSGTVLYYTTDGSDPRLPESMQINETILLTEDAVKKVLVPTGPVNNNWKGGGTFDDSGWNHGTLVAGKDGGVGYDENPDYISYISYNVESLMNADLNPSANNSCYIRIPFTFNGNPSGFNFMTLKIRYDDGFVAYLNGDQIKRINFPDTSTPVWNSNASGGHEASGLEPISVTEYLDSLKQGDNILAIHGMNTGTTSSDFLISAVLVAGDVNSTGGISPNAMEYNSEKITFTKSTNVKARVRDGITWSPLNEAIFAIGPVAENLRITEIMYHPRNTGNPNDPNEEFIELKNIGLDTLNLNLIRFTEGIDFTFPDMDLGPNEYVIVVKDQSAFEAQYGTAFNIAGQYTGSLANDGERIKLEDAVGQTILDFKYEDGWYKLTDGDGFSLTIIEPTDIALYGWNKGLVANWKFDDGIGSDAKDSGGTNDGILNGDPTWTTGRIDGALSFDGADDYVSLDPISVLAGDNFTAQAWVNLDEFAGVWNPVIIQHDSNNDGCYFYISNKRPSFYLIAGAAFAQAASPETVNANQWYHVAATNDGSNLKLYVDGVLKGSSSSDGLKGINYNAYIGYEPVSLLYYNGLIDDVRIYNRAVSEREFQDINDPMSRWSRKSSWRASVYRNGTPGADDSGILPNPGDIVINEIMTHSNDGPDWIELYNTTAKSINIGGWFLSDNDRDEPNLMKYRIADGTIIYGDDYLVFYQDTDFNDLSDPGCLVPFALSENGEEVCLSSYLDPNGMLTGYREVEDFGASATNVSLGRYYKSSTGNFNFVAMDYNTPDSNNAYPRVWPVVINEIMYNPPTGNQKEEYIELYNTTEVPQTLFRFESKNKPWKFTDGVDYTFSESPPVTILPHSYLLLVKDKAAFNARYSNIPGDVQVVEGYGGWLSNSGERLQLGMPGDIDEFGTRYYIRIDRVTYSDGSHPEDCPGGVDYWPFMADGFGHSLSRRVPSAYGNDVANWKAADPSPGTANP